MKEEKLDRRTQGQKVVQTAVFSRDNRMVLGLKLQYGSGHGSLCACACGGGGKGAAGVGGGGC